MVRMERATSPTPAMSLRCADALRSFYARSKESAVSSEPRLAIVDNEFITLWYWPAYRLVHHEMHRYTSGAPFRDALEAGLATMIERGGNKWLSDDRANNALPPADDEWARNEWFPRTKAAGWEYWAIVMPEKILGTMHLRRFAEDYAKHGITAHMFSDPDDALNWIKAFGSS
jgi:hypothetical protein